MNNLGKEWDAKKAFEAEELIKNDSYLRGLVDNLVWWAVQYAGTLRRKNPNALIHKDDIDAYTSENLGIEKTENL